MAPSFECTAVHLFCLRRRSRRTLAAPPSPALLPAFCFLSSRSLENCRHSTVTIACRTTLPHHFRSSPCPLIWPSNFLIKALADGRPFYEFCELLKRFGSHGRLFHGGTSKITLNAISRKLRGAITIPSLAAFPDQTLSALEEGRRGGDGWMSVEL